LPRPPCITHHAIGLDSAAPHSIGKKTGQDLRLIRAFFLGFDWKFRDGLCGTMQSAGLFKNLPNLLPNGQGPFGLNFNFSSNLAHHLAVPFWEFVPQQTS